MSKRGAEVQKAIGQLTICTPLLIALVDEVRQQIIIELANAGNEGLCVNDITATGNLSRPAISHHLKILKTCGLIKSRKKSTQIYYYLDLTERTEVLKGLIDALDSLIKVSKRDESALVAKQQIITE